MVPFLCIIFVVYGAVSVLFGLVAYLGEYNVNDDEIMKTWILPFDVATGLYNIQDGINSVLSTFFHLTILGRIFYVPVLFVFILSPYIIAEITHVIRKSLHLFWFSLCVKHDN